MTLGIGISTDGWGSFQIGPHLFYARKRLYPMTLQEVGCLGRELLEKLQELIGLPFNDEVVDRTRMIAERFLRDKLCVGEIYEYRYEKTQWQDCTAEAIDTEGEDV